MRVYSSLTETLHENFVELLCPLRIAGLEQAGSAATTHVGEEGELGNDQRRTGYIDQAQVHPTRLVREYAQVDDLVRKSSHIGFVVIGCRTYQQHVTGADGCTPLCTSLIPADRAGSNALRDDPQTFGPNCGSAWTSESM